MEFRDVNFFQSAGRPGKREPFAAAAGRSWRPEGEVLGGLLPPESREGRPSRGPGRHVSRRRDARPGRSVRLSAFTDRM